MNEYQHKIGPSAIEAELKALMLSSQDGNAAAHQRLLKRLSRHLRAYYKGKLGRVGRGAQEAEDLVQEAVLAIHIQRHTYDPEEPLTPWVHAIARYKLIDFLRRTRASVADVPIDEANEVTAHDDHLGVESSFDVGKLLSRLPEKMQCAIQAVKIDGLSVAEAALKCGISESGVKVGVHRGLKALAKLIAQGTKT
ncbi:sigma-70 family RNA polymerase sigma factor [Afipia broomeae]|uniref:Sigma-70 family RNA polymerase sigma factor n=1 Tax=Afipia broomeae ATCC 49717 TaxID=883078 RepID=K8P7X9_9BRAD|nr:sigma-70 family RNA polymerase sigma factor [Afipia broomeae ATCC 49717]